MGFVSDSRATAAAYTLRAAAQVVPCDTTSNYWVLGTCGHVLECIHPRHVEQWRQRIAEGRRHRRRCEGCPK